MQNQHITPTHIARLEAENRQLRRLSDSSDSSDDTVEPSTPADEEFVNSVRGRSQLSADRADEVRTTEAEVVEFLAGLSEQNGQVVHTTVPSRQMVDRVVSPERAVPGIASVASDLSDEEIVKVLAVANAVKRREAASRSVAVCSDEKSTEQNQALMPSQRMPDNRSECLMSSQLQTEVSCLPGSRRSAVDMSYGA